MALPVRLALLVFFAQWTCAPANAGESFSAALDDPVPGIQGVTYFDLVKQVVPDLQTAGYGYEGHKIIAMRHIGGEDSASDPPETASLSSVAIMPVQSDGKDRLLLLMELGQPEFSVAKYMALGLFNVSDTPTLVDVADVGFDQITYFQDPDRLSLGDGKDMVLTSSQHFNSSQGYVTTALILIRNDKLQLIDTVFTFNDRFCGFDRDETPEFHAGDRDGRTYSDIVATVTEVTKATDESCDGENPPKPGKRTFTVTYRWDEAASAFKPDSDAFDVLAKENEGRF